jgi:hypothetical protein
MHSAAEQLTPRGGFWAFQAFSRALAGEEIVVFGFATGTHSYALRLPPTERASALRADANRLWRYATGKEVLDLETIGGTSGFCGAACQAALSRR